MSRLSITPNTTKVTIYCYTAKSILKILKNPKHLKFINRVGYVKI
ncbi:MAG: hypothetical protein OXC46_02715 [Thaumarchaeota archaeon]|nr:hypothetical protein [Nitrososphaerota archaeon]